MFRVNAPPLHRGSQRKFNNNLHGAHKLGSDCLDRFWSIRKNSHHSIHPLAIAVFAACSLAITAPNVIDTAFAADWDGSDPSALEIVTPDLNDIHTVVKGVDTGNIYDFDSGSQNWLWTTQGSNEKPVLEIDVNGIVADTQNDGKFSDTYGSTNALWITASLKTILTSSLYTGQDYQNLAEATEAGPDYSSTTSNSSVILNFAERRPF